MAFVNLDGILLHANYPHPQKEDKKTNKTAFIKVRCTAEEKERIRSRATNAGRRYSDYCREMLLGGSVIAVPPMGDNEKEALAILRQTALFYTHISNLIKVKAEKRRRRFTRK